MVAKRAQHVAPNNVALIYCDRLGGKCYVRLATMLRLVATCCVLLAQFAGAEMMQVTLIPGQTIAT